MGTSAKNAKRKADLFEDDEDNKLGKRAKPFENKGPLNAIQTEDLKNLSGPPSPASIPSFEGRKPAEIFRTDLISAMKLPDTHILNPGTYINISDPWRQEWERGVQVPVNPDNTRQPLCRLVETQHKKTPSFKLPHKLLTPTSKKRSKTVSKCSYDLNRMDADWLASLNKTRYNKGLVELEEGMLEKSIAYLENQCYDRMGHAIATQAGLSIEYDESVCCDICQSPDSEESNEMVFCDNCDICVHQACYGIQNIPVGSWLCLPCRKGLKSVPCLLCPHSSGALKKTKNGKDWAHVSCSLWIPEVGFGSVEKMEPVTRIENIPQSRWNLVCSICREKVGACIQCSVKTCVTAFHVTCGFKHGLEMKTVLDDSAADGVRHISYCMRHGYKNKSPEKRKEEAPESAENLRQQRLKKMEEEFYKYVDVAEAAKDLGLPKELMKRIHAFWTLKRKAREDVPLLPPTLQQQQKLSGKQGAADASRNLEAQLHRLMKLRCNLERLRNLCYMVGKREKMSRDLYRVREQVFWKQHEMLTDEALSEEDLEWVLDMGRGHFTGAGGGAGPHTPGPASSCSSSSSGGGASCAGDRSSTEQSSSVGQREGSCSGSRGASDGLGEVTASSSVRHDSVGSDFGARDSTMNLNSAQEDVAVSSSDSATPGAGDVVAMSTGSPVDSEKSAPRKRGRKRKKRPGDLCVAKPVSSEEGLPNSASCSTVGINGEVPPANRVKLDSELMVAFNVSPRLVRRKRSARRTGVTSPQTDRSHETGTFATEDKPVNETDETAENGDARRSQQDLDSMSEITEGYGQSPRRGAAINRRGRNKLATRQAKFVASDVSGVKSSSTERCATETQKENEPIDTSSESSRKAPERVRTERVGRVIAKRAVDHETSGLEIQRAKPGKAPSNRRRSRSKSTDDVPNGRQAFITDFLRRRTPLRSSRSGGRQDRDSPAVSPRQPCAKTFANGAELHEHGSCPNCQAQHDRHAVLAADSLSGVEDPDEETPSRRLRVRSAQSSNSRARCSKEGLRASKPHCCESLVAKFLVK